MILSNKLGITDPIELSKAEEKISKQNAKRLFDSGDINQLKVGTFAGLKVFLDVSSPCALGSRSASLDKPSLRFKSPMIAWSLDASHF
jgi:hypothetical protein